MINLRNPYLEYYYELEKIFKHYGYLPQYEQFLEEFYELRHAIESNDDENIDEEMCDLWIMLTQLIFHGDKTDEYREIIEYKIKRTFFRIGKEKNDKLVTREWKDDKNT